MDVQYLNERKLSMKSHTKVWRQACRTTCLATLLLTGASYAQEPAAANKATAAETASTSQVLANAILMRMAKFLATAPRFSVNVHGSYDAVQTSGQKIEFSETRHVTVDRPSRLRVEGARSDGTMVATVFDGKEITLIDAATNVYATAPQPGNLDETIVYFVKDLHMQLPLAVLLVSELPAELKSRVRSIDYVEKTNINGAAVHHLAARGDTVDFQIWVTDSDQPLPQRIVITYKTAKGEPQFRAQFSDWNLAPEIKDSTFLANPPDGAQRIAFAAQLPQLSPTAGKRSSPKGAK
jgi:hypothetical protein